MRLHVSVIVRWLIEKKIVCVGVGMIMYTCALSVRDFIAVWVNSR